MKLYVLSGGKSVEILSSRVTWSGDYSRACRKLEFGMIFSNDDAFLPKINVNVGDIINLYEGNTLLFTGHVFTREKSHNSGEISVVAYDQGVYLIKNEAAYNFKGMTAESITQKVCNDFGIPVGDIASTGIKQSYVSIGNTLYEIIMKAYSKASQQNGKKYMPIMLKNKLYVIERGKLIANCTLENGINLENSTYTESIDEMINAVQIINDKGEKTGEVINHDWVKSYGKLQKVYKQEPGINANTAAKNMLSGITQTGTLDALGNISCITGFKVGVIDSYTGLVGLFNIDSDMHRWENGLYTMSLELNMDEIMDIKSYKNKKSKSTVSQPLKFFQ